MRFWNSFLNSLRWNSYRMLNFVLLFENCNARLLTFLKHVPLKNFFCFQGPSFMASLSNVFYTKNQTQSYEIE